MLTKEYLLDSNVIIKIWDNYPLLFRDIEKHESIDFKIYHSIAGELYKKEVEEFNGMIALTDRFIKLLKHIISEEDVEFPLIDNYDVSIKYDPNKNIYYINGNKLSKNDCNLICICQKCKQYTLVTEDKKIIKSAKVILETSRVLTLSEFLNDLKKFNII